ncbi:hypothetical protein F5Y13DRAFT_32967 [Hypoxylon sp. FL1857]|nr:hypothetical protein F5Y13DRAFT_32967 [Hypoxylon sp. FL1857]
MEDTEDTTAAMAQAMGFSSFGGQNNPNKRRKFNPRADAVVASTSTSTIPLHHGSATRKFESGSNATPLGVRVRNEDEIDLELDEDKANTPATGGRKSLQDEDNDDNDDPEPQYLDTSRPPAAIAVDFNNDVHSKIDTILGASSDPVLEGPSWLNTTGGGPNSQGVRGSHQDNRGHGHESGKKWWEGYYDPSSNVNPWERLEQAKGLLPRGDWMSWEEAKG